MRKLFFIFAAIFFSEAHASENFCDLIAPSNNPPLSLPSSWVDVTSGGNYATSQPNDNIFWQISVDYPSGIGCADPSLNNGPSTKRFCALIVADDPLTLDINENQLRVVFGDIVPISCPAGYQISAGQCHLLGECPVVAEDEICADGFPPQTGDYFSCDRPILKICGDGSFVREDIGICSQICTDYQTCLDFAVTGANCDSSQNFVFDYTDPENFSFSCSTIDVASPDNPDNGGNSDGNPFNDPNTPVTGPGSTPPVSDIDPQSLASAIGAELLDDLSAIERAVRDNSDQSKINTGVIEDAISVGTNKNSESFDNLETAIREGISSGEGGADAIRRSVDTLGSILGEISQKNAGPCDPTKPDYYSCLQNPLTNFPAHSSGEALTFADVNANFKTRLDGAPVIAAFSGIAEIVNFENSQCPPFEISVPAPIDKTVSTQIHCELMTDISPIIGPIMIIVYTVIGFRIFASA